MQLRVAIAPRSLRFAAAQERVRFGRDDAAFGGPLAVQKSPSSGAQRLIMLDFGRKIAEGGGRTR
jgi:hypothetical protein